MSGQRRRRVRPPASSVPSPGSPTTQAHAFDTDAVNGIVREYLVYAGLEESLAGFDAGLKEKGQTLSPRRRRESEGIRNARKHARLQAALIKAFTAGDGPAFFRLWNKHLPPSLLAKDLTARKLEFYVHIFFAIFPLHAWNTAPRDPHALPKSMGEFNAFLAKKGAALCKTSEFVAYYALPYVPNPTEHPSFRELFLEEWAANLKLRLERFLSAVLRTQNVPQLVTLYNAHLIASSAASPSSPVARARVAASESSLASLQYQQVLSLARELAETCASLVKGSSLPQEFMSSLASRLVSADVIPPGSEDLLLGQGQSMPHQQQHQHQQQQQQQQPPRQSSPGQSPRQPPREQQQQSHHANTHEEEGMPIITSFAPLSHSKIRHDLGPRSSLSSQERTLVLQALRWRLTRSRPARLRKKVMQSYIEADLFALAPALQNTEGLSFSLLQMLLVESSGTVQEYAARLVNTMASESAGRTYLLSSPETIAALVDVLFAEQGADSETRQNCLGALQKFSLRRAAQARMIQLGIITWLVSTLANADEVSEYTVEYGTALLMNLSLRPEGKIRAEDPELDILRVLSDLLSNENEAVRTYVNGTLYSVLSRKAVKARAAELGMEDMLLALKDEGDADFSEQLDYILFQLHAPPTDGEDEAAAADTAANPAAFDDEDEDENDEEEQADDYLAENEDEETIRAPPSVRQGEELLASIYLASLQDALEEERIVDQAMAARDARPPSSRSSRRSRPHPDGGHTPDDTPAFARPTTPAHSHSRPSSRPSTSRGSSRPGTSSDSLDINTDDIMEGLTSDDDDDDDDDVLSPGPAVDDGDDGDDGEESSDDDDGDDDDLDAYEVSDDGSDGGDSVDGEDDGQDGGEDDETPAATVPDPLASKPKIPRTPPGGRAPLPSLASSGSVASSTRPAPPSETEVIPVVGREVGGITRPPPTPKVMAGEYEEYVAAFGERAKVPRTPLYPQPSSHPPPSSTAGVPAMIAEDFDDNESWSGDVEF